MLPGPFKVPEIWHCAKISTAPKLALRQNYGSNKKNIFFLLGVNDPSKAFIGIWVEILILLNNNWTICPRIH
jgi:hypothetical protein